MSGASGTGVHGTIHGIHGAAMIGRPGIMGKMRTVYEVAWKCDRYIYIYNNKGKGTLKPIIWGDLFFTFLGCI